jgi:hypothetical protein
MFELYLIFIINNLNFNKIINFLLILFYKLFFESILFIIIVLLTIIHKNIDKKRQSSVPSM